MLPRSSYPRFLGFQLDICDVSFSWKSFFGKDARAACTDPSKIGQYVQDPGSFKSAADCGDDQGAQLDKRLCSKSYTASFLLGCLIFLLLVLYYTISANQHDHIQESVGVIACYKIMYVPVDTRCFADGSGLHNSADINYPGGSTVPWSVKLSRDPYTISHKPSLLTLRIIRPTRFIL